MLKRTKKLGVAAISILLLSLAATGMASIPAEADHTASGKSNRELTDSVRHVILMLPYYSVFDRLTYAIENNTVVLTGKVHRALLKSEAENAVRAIEEVAEVVNKIEILPLSRMDDSIRLRTYYAIFSNPGFERYAIQVHSPIRIIVQNGHITLDGIVSTQFDKTLAEMAARNVPMAFSVTNNLTVG